MKVDDKIGKVERLLEEIKSGMKPSKGIDADRIVDIVYDKVINKISKEGLLAPKLQPPEYILSKFQEEEVKRWEEAFRSLNTDEKKIASFVLALDKQTTKNEIITRLFGKEKTTGTSYQDYSKKIDRLVELEIFRTDKAKRIYPNLFEKISFELKTYNPSEEKIKQVMDRLKRILIEEVEKNETDME
jgi:ribosomal protein S20